MRISRELLLLASISFCAILMIGGIAYTKSKKQSQGEIEMFSNKKLMQAEIAKHIPLGSDIKQAKRLMKRNGFGCAIEINGTYKPNLSFEEASKRGSRTSLVCIKTIKFIFKNVWSVNIDSTGNKVAGHRVFYRSTASDF